MLSLQVRAAIGEKIEKEHAFRKHAVPAETPKVEKEIIPDKPVSKQQMAKKEQEQSRKGSSGSVKIRQADVDAVLQSKIRAVQEAEGMKVTAASTKVSAQKAVEAPKVAVKAAPKVAAPTPSTSDALSMSRFRTSNGSYGAFHNTDAYRSFH